MEEELIVNAPQNCRDRFFGGIRLVSSLQESKMRPLPTAPQPARCGESISIH